MKIKYISYMIFNSFSYCPRYEMIFKQAVTSEEMYLQMGNKNPSTASCEDMVVGWYADIFYS